MSNDLLLEKDGTIARLTINRPETRNPLGHSGDGEMFEAAAKEINADKALRCVIMTGAGKAFSAGGDLKAMRERTGDFGGSELELHDHYRAYGRDLLQRFGGEVLGVRIRILEIDARDPVTGANDYVYFAFRDGYWEGMMRSWFRDFAIRIR